MLRGCTTAVVVLAFSFAPVASDARSFRQDEVPNGSRVGCTLCHVGVGGPRNAFGEQCNQSQEIPGDGESPARWELIYNLDADQDGFTNGEELGDPDGTWRPFQPQPTYRSHPSDPQSVPQGEPDPEPEPEPEPDTGDNDDVPDAEQPTPDVQNEIGGINDVGPAEQEEGDEGYTLGPSCGTHGPIAPAKATWLLGLIMLSILGRRGT